MFNVPRVGIALVIKRIVGGKIYILLHKRKSCHANGKWACAGGHLEKFEDIEECALREMAEECGPHIAVTRPKFLTVHNAKYYDENKHYVVVFMVSNWICGIPRIMEPDKCECWKWFNVDNLPEDCEEHGGLMQGIENLLQDEVFINEIA